MSKVVGAGETKVGGGDGIVGVIGATLVGVEGKGFWDGRCTWEVGTEVYDAVTSAYVLFSDVSKLESLYTLGSAALRNSTMSSSSAEVRGVSGG